MGESHALNYWRDLRCRYLAATIPYGTISSLEYGQKAGRRVGVAIMVSPIALFSKKRKHFLTVGYKSTDGKDQGVVFKLGKDIVRSTLVSIEARSGKKLSTKAKRQRST